MTISSLLPWLLVSLAVYRLAELISVDTLTEPIRSSIGRRAAASGESINWRGWKLLANLINCPYCTGVWIAIIGAIALRPDSLSTFILYWLSLAGAQAFLEALSQRASAN